MPNLPISQLPASNALTGAELFADVQDGVTKYTTLSDISTYTTYLQGNNYGLFSQTGSSSAVSGSDPSGSLIDGGIGTLSVPANGFTKGDAFQVVMSGVMNVEVNGDTLEITIGSDGVVLAGTGVISMPKISNKNWILNINFSINEVGGAGTAEIATAGTITFRKDAAGEVITEIFSTINNTTFDTTITNTLQINAEWGNGPSADSTIYSQLFTLRKIY